MKSLNSTGKQCFNPALKKICTYESRRPIDSIFFDLMIKLSLLSFTFNLQVS